MNALFSGILAVALSNSAPIIHQEYSFVAGYSAYAEGNYTQTRRIWEKLAHQGNAQAQYGLAVMYEFGQGVTHSYALAAHWYGEASQMGYAMAKNNLGMLYEKGLGVPLDIAKAVEYYRQAAQQGLASSQYNLGLMHYEGIGLEQDYEQASYWLRRSAAQGFASAQYNLGLMYQQGVGVEQNHVEAARWFIQAINTGASRAYSGLQALLQEKTLTQTIDNVTLRQHPDASSDAITQLPSGNRVYTLELQEDWIAVLLDDKKTLGWIERAAIK
jgi:hypothetical protein